MIQRELEGTWLDLVGEHHRQQQGVAVNGLVAGHGTWISGRCPSNASCTAKDDDQPINRRLFAQPQRESNRRPRPGACGARGRTWASALTVKLNIAPPTWRNHEEFEHSARFQS